MNRRYTLARKDLKLLIRDKSAMFWVLIFPLLIAILFGSIFGGSSGVSKINVTLVDEDHSAASSALVAKLRSSSAISLTNAQRTADSSSELDAAKEAVRKGNLSAYILVPKGFGEEVRTFQYGSGPAIRIGIDPSRQAEAGMLNGVVAKAAYEMMGEQMSGSSNPKNLDQNLASIQASSLPPQQKEATTRLLKDLDSFYKTGGVPNATGGSSPGFQGPSVETDKISAAGATPASSFEVTFPQALIWGLLGVISSFAISLVKEREQGTLIRLRASPMSMSEILGGKALACFLACAGVMFFLLLIGHFLFGVRITSPSLLALAIGCGAFCIVGIMMLLSVLGKTEQAVAGSSWGVMIIMAMFGGGMIPVFMMPGWMQSASNISPLKWTVLSIEGAIWRGFTFAEMVVPCLVLVGVGVVCFAAGVRVLRARG